MNTSIVGEKLIICSGMKRSGSTLQFNIVRALLAANSIDFENLKYLPGDQLGLLAKSRQLGKPALLKCHELENVVSLDLPKIILYTVRDPRDAYLSAKLKWNKDIGDLPEIVDAFVCSYRLASRTEGVLIQRYEELFGNEREAIETVGQFLGLNSNQSVKDSILNEVSVESVRAGLATRMLVAARNRFRPILVNYPIAKKMSWPLRVGYSFWNHRRLAKSKTQLHIDHISRNNGQIGMWESQLESAELDMFANKYASVIEEMGYRNCK
ncbi:sulfotransferase family protein [Mariniblastus fucicola]|uniref:Sulfotransferase domain protein n=1 Tax=Mariniblastus fucicola TaxID=980251 RepID=A0A5B9P278_9BACT|nr:hypothetical protein [Mariniblastus fucicola]QEG20294.1 Sulfotransferase domain protein [Mariniblastus fucicola]